jgi:monovalent cation:H+ antiporter-2, CPA2 family
LSDPAVPANVAATFIELGALLAALGLLARFASRFGFSAIPFYLLAGVALGEGGVLPVSLSTEFIRLGAEIGVILLMFMVGLEYTAEELAGSLRAGLPAGVMDLLLNFTPGVAAGFLLGFGPVGALLIGGVTYNTSTGVMARVLTELNRLGNRETPAVLAVSVMEDLGMAIYLPLIAVLLLGTGAVAGVLSVTVAIGTVVGVLFAAYRYGSHVSRAVAFRSDEVTLLTVFGLVLLAAGVADTLSISAAVGAFLLGLGLSGEVAEHTRQLLGPLRDLFAAMFFFFFGLQIDPGTLPPALLPATVLALVTAATKMYTGWWAAARIGVGIPGRVRAGTALIPRGEFSLLLAGLAVTAGLDPRIGSLAAAYVLLLALAAPIIARSGDVLTSRWLAARPGGRAPLPSPAQEQSLIEV